MPRIDNRFTELLEKKRRRDRKPWTYREIGVQLGMSPATLSRFAQQHHTQYDADTLVRLCLFLDASLADLLVIVDDEGRELELGKG